MKKKSESKLKKTGKTFSEADRKIFARLEKMATAVPISTAYLPSK